MELRGFFHVRATLQLNLKVAFSTASFYILFMMLNTQLGVMMMMMMEEDLPG